MHQRIVRATIAWLAPCFLLASGAAGAADAAKVLRIALPTRRNRFRSGDGERNLFLARSSPRSWSRC